MGPQSMFYVLLENRRVPRVPSHAKLNDFDFFFSPHFGSVCGTFQRIHDNGKAKIIRFAPQIGGFGVQKPGENRVKTERSESQNACSFRN